jgi:retron-type reverse transcriptase
VKILHCTNIPILLLSSIIAIYCGNKMKAKINNQVSEEHTINHGVRQGCPASPTLFNIYMNEITVK